MSTAWLCRSQQWAVHWLQRQSGLEECLRGFRTDPVKSRMAREEHFDCLVIGAGISGLDAAYHIQKHARWGLFE